MCLILLAHRYRDDFPLILAGNRDEYFDRPTAPAGFWADAPHVLAGRDRVSGGTWLGVTRDGRWAALSNYRDPGDRRGGDRSRGRLVADFLQGAEDPRSFLHRTARQAEAYKGFNLLAGNPETACYYSNRDGNGRELSPGIYGLSNHLLDTPWPKVVRSKEAFRRLLDARRPPSPKAVFDILTETRPAPDAQLPDTGVGLERERLLSARFIVSPAYGTRASTVVLVGASGRVFFVERTHAGSPDTFREVRFRFRLTT